MTTGIFLIQPDKSLIELTEQTYDSESVLQSLLVDYPNLLAGSQIDPDNPRRWLLVSREMGVPIEEGGGNWMSLDHLFLDQDAIPTLVEVKRSADTRLRREVVGQLLDYAANAVQFWPIHVIQERFAVTCEKRGMDPDQALAKFLDPEQDAGEFWEAVQENLKAGRMRLLFVADEIPAELQSIIEFLNRQMNPAEVLGVEIKQFVGEGLQTLVPRVIGQTQETVQRKRSTSAKKQWNAEMFFTEMTERHGEGVAAAAGKILEWANAHTTRIDWGKGIYTGSFVPIFRHKETDHQLFAVYTTGNVEIYFQWYGYKPPFDSLEKRREIMDRLNQLPNVSIPEDGINRRPSISLSVFEDERALQGFFQVYEWYLDVIRDS